MKQNSEMRLIIGLFVAANAALGSLSAAIVPVSDKVACAVADRQAFTQPDQLHLTGWIGARVEANEANRLVKIDVDRLLEGYRKRPGRQTWDGEHVGKWLHAATLAWVNTGDPALRQKLDYAAAELIKCQQDDGYLGTYLERDRWTEWDVWAHKYNLIGLITYMRYTGHMTPLPACCRMGDLLCNTFGDGPGKRDIIKAGEHVGLAPTSVLEPMVLLYRLTGEQRYLEFCKYILRAWEHPNGPRVISTLLAVKRVDKVGNGKAYEMLSCLNGALEYYRTVGADAKILEACLNAWQDIVAKRLYITGAASYGELFHDDFDLPNVANVGETCVTVTWLQFNAQLLRLTGEARFAEQLEHVVLNQLFGAQKCDGSGWGYYVQMEGKKPYSSTLDGHCCLSSGPRGVALIPTFAVSTDAAGVVVNLYDAGTAKLSLDDKTPVTLVTETRYPAEEHIRITMGLAGEKDFTLKLRRPAWCREASVQIKGQPVAITPGPDGYVEVHRSWKDGDQVELRLKLEPRVIVGDHKNTGKLAVLYGPLVLAADADLLGDQLQGTGAVAFATADLAALAVTPEPAPDKFKTWAGAQVYRVNAIPRQASKSGKTVTSLPIRLVPFADAGTGGSNYRVWIPIGQTEGNLLSEEKESRSRRGNASGSITDGDPDTFVVTFEGKPAAEDWFAVTLAAPAEVKRVVFVHGKSFHDGGWFDASAGQPQVQVQTTEKGKWETVGVLKDYPATTTTSAAGLTGGERFTCELPKTTRVFGVRVVGKPASGDNPQQAFASCGELFGFLGAPMQGKTPNVRDSIALNFMRPDANRPGNYDFVNNGPWLVGQFKEIGVKWNRVAFSWVVIQPEENRFDWSAYDRIVEACEKSRIEILATLGGHFDRPPVPAWAGSTLAEVVEKHPERLEAFILAWAERYKGKIHFYEILNEPRVHHQGLTVRAYVEGILKPGYRIIKSVDPQAKVLPCAYNNLPVLGTKEDFWDLARGSYDIGNYHQYADWGIFRIEPTGERDELEVRQFRAEMDKHGEQDKPFWLTEIGFWGTGNLAGIAAAGERDPELKGRFKPFYTGREYLDHPAVTREDAKRALWIKDVFPRVLAVRGCEKAFLWVSMDEFEGGWKPDALYGRAMEGQTVGQVDLWGIIAGDRTWRKSAYVLQEMLK